MTPERPYHILNVPDVRQTRVLGILAEILLFRVNGVANFTGECLLDQGRLKGANELPRRKNTAGRSLETIIDLHSFAGGQFKYLTV